MKRSRVATIAVVTVVAAGTVVGLWWKPWQSPVALPKSGCWGSLGPNDIRPVVGTDGRAETAIHGNLLLPWLMPTGPQDGDPFSECYISWNGRVVATANVSAHNSSEIAGFESQTQDKLETLAPGIQMLPDSDDVKVIFRCDRLQPKFAYGVADASSLDGGIDQSGPTEAERNGYANIALKLAKAAAPQIHCNNPLDFPSSVPTLKPYPKV